MQPYLNKIMDDEALVLSALADNTKTEQQPTYSLLFAPLASFKSTIQMVKRATFTIPILLHLFFYADRNKKTRHKYWF